jgi:hypothetical protein
VRPRERTGDDLGELAGLVVAVAPLDGDEHVHPVAAAGLREAGEAKRIENVLDQERDLDDLGEADVGCGIEVEEDEVRSSRPVDPRVPRVQVDTAHVHHPEQRQLVVDHRRADLPAAPRRLARGHLELACGNPLRHVHRSVLLEEVAALDPVRVALHGEGPVLHMRQEHGCDGPVVREQVALRDPVLGEEHLVEVRQLEHALPRADLVRQRLLAVHLA